MRISSVHFALTGIVLGGAWLLATALGQSPPGQQPTKAPATAVAVCDVAGVFANCRQSGDMTGDFHDRRAALKAEDQKRVKAMNALSLELQELKPGSSAYEQRLLELEKMEIDRKGWRDLEELKLRRWHIKMTKELYEKIIATIARVSQERGIQIVLDRDQRSIVGDDAASLLAQIARQKVLYSAESADLTAVVLSRLNEEYRPERP